MPVIRECCNYFGMELPSFTYFDSLLIARKTWPEAESHKLTELGKNFEIKYLAHDALEDSRTCGKVVNLAAEKWSVSSVEELLFKCELEINHL